MSSIGSEAGGVMGGNVSGPGISGGVVSFDVLVDWRGVVGFEAEETIWISDSSKRELLDSLGSVTLFSETAAGAAIGSAKTGSTLVVLVIFSIAFCRSSSTG